MIKVEADAAHVSDGKHSTNGFMITNAGKLNECRSVKSSTG